jgi:hypothetical protein
MNRRDEKVLIREPEEQRSITEIGGTMRLIQFELQSVPKYI